MPHELVPDIPGFGPERCECFLDGTRGADPRALLVSFLASVDRGARALDIGCGPGRETVAMLQHGLRVVAIDPYPRMVELARAAVDASCPDARDRVAFHMATVERFAPQLAPKSFELVHAGFVLPFVRARDFPPTFSAIRAALCPGGLLVAQFFGPDDEFIRESGREDMTAHTAAELDATLAGLEALHREEVNRSGFVGKGRAKWWHVHHVVARAPVGRH